MKRGYALFTSLALLTVGFAGCFGSSSGFDAPDGVDRENAAVVQGQVLDAELLPVPDALVTLQDGEWENTTDAQGVFQLGPVPPGEHTLVIEKAGYAPFQQPVFVRPNGDVAPVTAILTPVASDVPYHLSEVFVTFVYCASYNPIGGVPCTKLVDYVAGTNISSEERFNYPFTIDNPGLVDMLVEMKWQKQQFAGDMLYMIQTPPGQPATALTTKYFTKEGPSPLTGWVTAGVANQCGGSECAGVFDAEPGNITYEALTVWSDDNGTVPGIPGTLSGVSLYLNHRTETWHTFFHNREGPRTFSALPDE